MEILGEKDKKINGIKFLHNNKEEILEIDSLAVDGKFIVEHKMRDILELKWDLENWEAKLKDGFYLNDDIIIIGDANRPDCNFMYQYEKAYNFAKEI